jgi:hypothetical protein
MKIGDAGEAFFVFETDADVPDDLITSPLLQPTQPVSPDPLPLGDTSDEAVGQEPDFLDLNAPSSMAHSLPGTSFRPTVHPSSFANARNASAPVSMEGKEGMPQNVHGGPVITISRDTGRYMAGHHDHCSTDRDLEKADGEAHRMSSMKEFPTSHVTKAGGVSCHS